MNMKQVDEKLTRVLADWRLAPTVDPQFRPGVWARIERARREVAFGEGHIDAWYSTSHRHRQPPLFSNFPLSLQAILGRLRRHDLLGPESNQFDN
jgi:hypothetical protein